MPHPINEREDQIIANGGTIEAESSTETETETTETETPETEG